MTHPAEIQCVVLIASPNTAVRRRLKKALKETFSVYQVTGRVELERSIGNLKPSVLFIDLAIQSIIKRLKSIQRLSLSTKILALSASPDLNEAVLALEAGVKGYCHRDIDHFLLRKAVLMVQKGELWVERGIIPHLVKKLSDRKRQPGKRISAKEDRLKQLTARQREIAGLIAEGSSNKEIASFLDITEATVKAHIHLIFRKLAVSDRLGLALLVRENRPYIR